MSSTSQMIVLVYVGFAALCTTRAGSIAVAPHDGVGPDPKEVANAILTLSCVKGQETIACEGNVARLTCPPDTVIRVTEANYGRSDFPTCPHPQRSNLNCGDRARSISTVRHECDNRRHCVVTATNGVFGDPCVGTFKYLQVKYDCEPAFSVIACEGSSATLSCPTGEVIRIIKALYGRTEFQLCPHPARGNLACGSASHSLANVQSRCDYQASCTVPSSNGVFGDPCPGTYKYLEVQYRCG
ncbi:L-rhamnose-binding lectin CSL3-like [Oscarella lobularis]|uniref:L-rhamnose-binding lectin CSL3-like n=1 Tax=Oscarella lobularis TaxID=121494 RepID=UPI003313754F